MKNIALAVLVMLSTLVVAQDRCKFTEPTAAKVVKMHIQYYTHPDGKNPMLYALETEGCSIEATKSSDPMGGRFDINVSDVLTIKKFKNGHFDVVNSKGKTREMYVISAE